MRDRKRGWGSLSLVAFVIVLAGASRSDLFEPALIPGIASLLAALTLFGWARIAIHGKFFSYINSTDVPQFVCTAGPYHWIRHPFYASYLLTLLAVTVMFPTYVTIIGAIVAIVAFTNAAKFEESKFEGSPVAAEYAAYMQRTGRFLPRM
jgi:protein-S-isoprenylcysteine O-methyltransferase Ste14